jgi:hypothetical protein
MEAKYKSLSVFEFHDRFKTDDHCEKYLSELKWGNGFKCIRCGHSIYCKGVAPYDRQCNSCNYIESPTAGTLFHMCKFSLVKAFWIVYYVSTSKKGISSTELSRKLQLRQKTCWSFKQKVMVAMKSSKAIPMVGQVEVDETYVGGQDDQAIGRNEGKKKLVVFAIEKKDKGVLRIYGKVIETASNKNLQEFMNDHIDSNANVKTDGWRGYTGAKTQFTNLIQEKSISKGKNFRDMHRVIMGFKGWLRGMHHSVNNLQAYIDEYCYRFNRHKMNGDIFENLLNRMVIAKPYLNKSNIN